MNLIVVNTLFISVCQYLRSVGIELFINIRYLNYNVSIILMIIPFSFVRFTVVWSQV